MSERNDAHTDPETDHSARGRAISQIVFNALVALIAAALFWNSLGLPSSMWEPLGAGSFPRLALGALIGFNVLLIATQIPAVIGSSKLTRGALTGWLWRRRLAFVVLALFLAYVIGIHWLGFAWASLVFVLVTQIVLGARSPRALVAAVVIALAFSFGLDALFGRVFNILLPTGVLFG